MSKYQVVIPKNVYEQVYTIHNYIKYVLGNPTAALKMSQEIMKSMRSLETFPNRGFDADEKAGKRMAQFVHSKGLVICQGKYLLFYTIDDDRKKVYITKLISANSDYMRYFL